MLLRCIDNTLERRVFSLYRGNIDKQNGRLRSHSRHWERERKEMANIQVCTTGLHVISSLTVKYAFVLIDKDECEET